MSVASSPERQLSVLIYNPDQRSPGLNQFDSVLLNRVTLSPEDPGAFHTD